MGKKDHFHPYFVSEAKFLLWEWAPRRIALAGSLKVGSRTDTSSMIFLDPTLQSLLGNDWGFGRPGITKEWGVIYSFLHRSRFLARTLTPLVIFGPDFIISLATKKKATPMGNDDLLWWTAGANQFSHHFLFWIWCFFGLRPFLVWWSMKWGSHKIQRASDIFQFGED